MPREAYQFGQYRLDSRTRNLWRGTELVPLRGREFDTLWAIARRLGTPVNKYQILKEFWDHGANESNVTD